MTKQWRELMDFPGYAVSNEGDVMNTTTDLLKRPSRNQQGIVMVNFSIKQAQHVRSVAVIVANEFLSRDGVPDHFDTPIHLNGDRTDCRVENLLWRPRWFAIRYHQQFSPDYQKKYPGFHAPVYLVNTDEVFPRSWEAAVKYGLLDREILIAMFNGTYVFPLHFRFEEHID